MKRISMFLAVTLGLAAPGLAQPVNSTVGELLATLKASTPNQGDWMVVPVAGGGPGQNGSTFHTDLALTGDHAHDDVRIAIAWLPVGRDASADPVAHMTLTGDFYSAFTLFHDGVGGSGSGFGAFVIAAVDDNGALDSQGHVSANVRVWSPSSCAGETSFGYHAGQWLAADGGSVIGLTLNKGFRSNVGIVNADASAHTWRVRYGLVGYADAKELEVSIDAASSTIVSLPGLVSGPIHVTIEAEDSGVAWTAWGASVDNDSGDGWYAAAHPASISTPPPGPTGPELLSISVTLSRRPAPQGAKHAAAASIAVRNVGHRSLALREVVADTYAGYDEIPPDIKVSGFTPMELQPGEAEQFEVILTTTTDIPCAGGLYVNIRTETGYGSATVFRCGSDWLF